MKKTLLPHALPLKENSDTVRVTLRGPLKATQSGAGFFETH